MRRGQGEVSWSCDVGCTFFKQGIGRLPMRSCVIYQTRIGRPELAEKTQEEFPIWASGLMVQLCLAVRR